MKEKKESGIRLCSHIRGVAANPGTLAEDTLHQFCRGTTSAEEPRTAHTSIFLLLHSSWCNNARVSTGFMQHSSTYSHVGSETVRKNKRRETGYTDRVRRRPAGPHKDILKDQVSASLTSRGPTTASGSGREAKRNDSACEQHPNHKARMHTNVLHGALSAVRRRRSRIVRGPKESGRTSFSGQPAVRC